MKDVAKIAFTWVVIFTVGFLSALWYVQARIDWLNECRDFDYELICTQDDLIQTLDRDSFTIKQKQIINKLDSLWLENL